MCSDITVRELAGMTLDEDVVCQIWTPQHGTVFSGSFEEAKYSAYADREIDNFQVEDGVFVMNI
mgnify:FL=1|jgi:hypothetical protein